MAKEKRKAKGRKRRVALHVTSGVAHIQATFNNTIISITDPQGNVISWSSAGQVGFAGSRKSTAFAAQVAAEAAASRAREAGMRDVRVHVSGPNRASSRGKRPRMTRMRRTNVTNGKRVGWTPAEDRQTMARPRMYCLLK